MCDCWSCKLNRLVSVGHYFHLREQVINKIWLFRLGYLTVIFLKINEVSLSLEGEQYDSIC